MEENIVTVSNLVKREGYSLRRAVQEVAKEANCSIVSLLNAYNAAQRGTPEPTAKTTQQFKRTKHENSALAALLRGQSIRARSVDKCIDAFRTTCAEPHLWLDQALLWVSLSAERTEEWHALPADLQNRLLIILSANMWDKDKQVWVDGLAPCRRSDGSSGWAYEGDAK